MTTRTAPPSSRSATERTLLWLEMLLAIGGAAGFVFGGVDLGDATADLPFGSTLFAGLALAAIDGVLPSVVVAGALQRRPWAIGGHLAVGVALVAWIVVQVAVLGPPLHWLQVLYAVSGA
jgi:hypothetical protein